MEQFKPYFEKYTQYCQHEKKRLCCYHNEKTGSANIYDTGDGVIYHCFGCGVSVNPINFLIHQGGFSAKEAFEEFGLSISPKHQTKPTINSQLVFDRETNRYKTIEEKFKDLTSDGYKIPKNCLYRYDVPINSQFTPYFKVKFIHPYKNKEFRFFHFEEETFINKAPKEQIPYNYCEALNWRDNIQESFNSERDLECQEIKTPKTKLILTEGEKDSDTINMYIDSSKCISISLKGLNDDSMEKFMEEILFITEVFIGDEKKLKKIYVEEVYFIGDEDIPGFQFRKKCFEACKKFVKRFYVLHMSRLTSILEEGMDITDWWNQQENKSKARKIFFDVLDNPHILHNFCLSEKWAAVTTKEKKGEVTYIPTNSEDNLESFCQYYEFFFKREMISGFYRGEYGLLDVVRSNDRINCPVNMATFQTLVNRPSVENGKSFTGMGIVKLENFTKLFTSVFDKYAYNDMLSKIDQEPKCFNLVEKIEFEYQNIRTSYEVPELVSWLLNEIKFVSEPGSLDTIFQQLLILKGLLGLPAMLRNTIHSAVSVKGDLRFVGVNSIGKTEFVLSLFGEGYNYSQIPWIKRISFFDVTKIDHQKIAASSPCAFLDEGNVLGKASEQRGSMDNQYLNFVEKYETMITTVVKRFIFISSSNHLCSSIDLYAERRLWVVELASVPHLRKMSCKEYYDADRGFWDKYLTEKDFFTINENGSDVRYFRFPVLEFWRQMNKLYKYYENVFDQIYSLQGKINQGELGYYKNEWMVDKYVTGDLQDKILAYHDWDDKSKSLLKIPVFIFNEICEKILYRGHKNLKKNYDAIFAMTNRRDEIPKIMNPTITHKLMYRPQITEDGGSLRYAGVLKARFYKHKGRAKYIPFFSKQALEQLNAMYLRYPEDLQNLTFNPFDWMDSERIENERDVERGIGLDDDYDVGKTKDVYNSADIDFERDFYAVSDDDFKNLH